MGWLRDVRIAPSTSAKGNLSMQKPTVTVRVPRDQTRAVLLAALLGDFGLHHFYLGQPFLGLLYLLFCWTGIPGVLATLEACRYGFMSTTAWAERFNGGTLGKPVPRWLPLVLIGLPLLMLAAILAAIYAGYDF
jgi:TM2 domain-containing membrane protein YozV